MVEKRLVGKGQNGWDLIFMLAIEILEIMQEQDTKAGIESSITC